MWNSRDSVGTGYRSFDYVMVISKPKFDVRNSSNISRDTRFYNFLCFINNSQFWYKFDSTSPLSPHQQLPNTQSEHLYIPSYICTD
ncbi:hypothetical protein HanRHA438_Chr15g0696571 [Helianthus annuus]|nr:hypothetical protein HanRHA438_Chr15g0696571 [Helianthus annuus]